MYYISVVITLLFLRYGLPVRGETVSPAGAKEYFSTISLNPRLKLVKEIKASHKIPGSLEFYFQDADIRLVFSEQLDNELKVHLKHYAIDTAGQALVYETDSGRVHIGLEPGSSLLNLFTIKERLAVFIRAPARVEDIQIKNRSGKVEVIADHLAATGSMLLKTNGGKVYTHIDTVELFNLYTVANGGVLNMKFKVIDFFDDIYCKGNFSKVNIRVDSLAGEGDELDFETNGGIMNIILNKINSYQVFSDVDLGVAQILTDKGSRRFMGFSRSYSALTGEGRYKISVNVNASFLYLDLK